MTPLISPQPCTPVPHTASVPTSGTQHHVLVRNAFWVMRIPHWLALTFCVCFPLFFMVRLPLSTTEAQHLLPYYNELTLCMVPETLESFIQCRLNAQMNHSWESPLVSIVLQ